MMGQENETASSVNRVQVVKLLLLLCFGVVAFRLIKIQVIEAGHYQEIAKRQYEARVPLNASRGNIYDRNGRLLVSNLMYVSFGADPKMIGDVADNVADRFVHVFRKSREPYISKLTETSRHFVWLERQVDPRVAKKIDAPAFGNALIQLNEPKRLYYYESLAGQLIGFTDVDNNGLGGIEKQFDGDLHGINGYMVMQRDGLGRKRPVVDYPRQDPVNGHHLVLTIDLEYQAIAEDELRKGVERNGAESGLALMLDPATGEVLAMANFPSINPNNLNGTDEALLKNRIITDMFEPGSVFKVVVASAALEKHLVKPDQKFFAENGRYMASTGGGKPRLITDTHPYGMITFQQGMEYSSNIVMAKVSDIVGPELLYTSARAFGFGTETGIELPGEVSGELKKPVQWSGTTLNSMAFGYEVGVTPLQIAAAYAAVANNGVLMKPYVVRQVLGTNGAVLAEFSPKEVRTVISASTVQTLTRFFEGVVDRGTGKLAKVPGLAIAGKTGTSRKFIGGKYEEGKYTASFVGFFPADAPKVVCLVMLDNPKAGQQTGGLASAPIFKAIAEKVYATSGRFGRKAAPGDQERPLFTIPDVRSLNPEVAKGILVSRGFTVVVQGTGSIVLSQAPQAGVRVLQGSKVALVTSETEVSVPAGFTVVPDVRTLSIRRAINRLTMQQLDVSINGSGVVVSQSPAQGTKVKIGTRVGIKCESKGSFIVSAN